MQNINIGKSGISVPFLGMGTWAIGGGAWWGDNDDALSVKAIQTAVEQGIQWIDTAPIYGLYHSEEVVGEAMKHIDRDKVVLSTKCGLEWRHETPILHKVVDGVQVYRDLSAKGIIEDVEDSLRRLESYFKGRPAMGENQRKQAMLPEGATVFPNDIGTAPGCGVRTASGKVIVMLPGPPSELVPMLQHYVVPFLKEGSHAVIHSCMIRTFGLGEGAGALKIADLTDAANPTAATYAKENEMFVRVTARAESEEAAEALCRPVVEEICRRYGDVVYGVDVDNLESVVVRLLSEKGLHLATAESCTGGLVAKLITDVSGASEVFGMGLVTYANEAKMKLLGVPAAMLEEHGAVSEPVARAMAEGVREVSGSELGIGITGVAGPTGGTPEKPVGLIYIALSDGTRTWVRRMTPPGRVHGRGWLRDRAAGTALDMVRRYLSDLPLEPVQSAGPATTL